MKEIKCDPNDEALDNDLTELEYDTDGPFVWFDEN
jgi:hypothetical protein